MSGNKDFDKPEIGMLWINREDKGSPVTISGSINGEKVLILLNRIKYKQAKGAPDYKVFSCDKEVKNEYQPHENEYQPKSDNNLVNEDEFDF